MKRVSAIILSITIIFGMFAFNTCAITKQASTPVNTAAIKFFGNRAILLDSIGGGSSNNDLKPALKTENKIIEGNTLTAAENYFIPYGALYNMVGDEEYVYPAKNAAGIFAVVSGTAYTYTQYLIPASGIKTFGVSEMEYNNSPAKQFGTYCTIDKTGRGTMVIAGDVSALKEKFSDLSDTELATKLSDFYNTKNPNGKYAYVRMTFNNNANYVRVYKVAQKKYMWTGNDAIEYAVRVYDLNANEEYAGIGYFTDGETLVFSDKIKGLTDDEPAEDPNKESMDGWSPWR